MLTTEKTKIEVSPSTVIYRTPLCFSVAVIKVLLGNKENPRIIAFTQDVSGLTPMSLFLDEILWYSKDAVRRVEEMEKNK